MRGALPLALLLALALPAAADDAARRVDLRLKPLPPDCRSVAVEEGNAGERLFLVERLDGTVERLPPDAFARLLLDEGRERGLVYRFLNITSAAGILWVGLGLLGQVLFTGRMLLQWLVSERARRSVVPVGFWWLSLVGASMLLAYFLWRRDLVGVLGQCAGWVVYVRNLWLIYRERAGTGVAGPVDAASPPA